jgi:hypothetical protein
MDGPEAAPTRVRISTRPSNWLSSIMVLHDLFFLPQKMGLVTRHYAPEACQRRPNTDALSCLKRKLPNGLLMATATLFHHGDRLLIARRGMRTLRKNCNYSEDTPMSRSSSSDPLLRDKELLHIVDTCERKPANHRRRPGSGPCSRQSRGRPECSRAVRMRGRSGPLLSPPPSSRVAWERGASHTAERIVVWKSW